MALAAVPKEDDPCQKIFVLRPCCQRTITLIRPRRLNSKIQRTEQECHPRDAAVWSTL